MNGIVVTPRSEAGRIQLPSSLAKCTQEQLRVIRESVIGRNTLITTPFGQRMLTYCDYVASGRSLNFLEDRMVQQVMPTYANTHTEASATGKRTGQLRESARATILNACGGSHLEHCVIFTGSGATSAIDTFKNIIMRKDNVREKGAVVIVGPHEHHSNILPWRESAKVVVQCKLTEAGEMDLEHAEQLLKKYRGKNLILGTFSAASNIDGTLTEPRPLVELFHRYGAFISFDYAAAAPYVDIDLQRSGADAIFISTHKFVGGPGTPGVLVCRKSILERNSVPHRPAGGTVLLVTDDSHVYLDDVIEREEGGTPDVLGAIRAGLVFQIKQDIGAANIHMIEESLLKQCAERFRKIPGLAVLGNPESDRLATFSFLVRHGDKFLHHSFVTQLLNDIFGIQSRNGCGCAGPYSLKSLGISQGASKLIGVAVLTTGHAILKPGFTRVQLPYFASEDEINFIIDALEWVSINAWKLLVLYAPNPTNSQYKMKEDVRRQLEKVIKVQKRKVESYSGLFQFDWSSTAPTTRTLPSVNVEDMQAHYRQYLEAADSLLPLMKDFTANARSSAVNYINNDLHPLLIWFVQANEVAAAITNNAERLDLSESGLHLFMPPIVGRDSTASVKALLHASRKAVTPRECRNRMQVIDEHSAKLVEPSLYSITKSALLKPKMSGSFNDIVSAKLRRSSADVQCCKLSSESLSSGDSGGGFGC